MKAKIEEQPTAFGKWCVVRGIRALPATPQDVAAFIRDQTAPLEKIWPWVKQISQNHILNGFADPTAGGLVAHIVNNISNLDAPASWKKEEKARFYALPYDVQIYIKTRDRQRDTEMHRAQREAADIRRELAALKQQEQKSNETDTQNQTAAA